MQREEVLQNICSLHLGWPIYARGWLEPNLEAQLDKPQWNLHFWLFEKVWHIAVHGSRKVGHNLATDNNLYFRVLQKSGWDWGFAQNLSLVWLLLFCPGFPFSCQWHVLTRLFPYKVLTSSMILGHLLWLNYLLWLNLVPVCSRSLEIAID